MQAFTHFIFGVLFGVWYPGFWGLFWAFWSHPILDIMAKSTYHPPNALWKDTFWCFSHAAFFAIALAYFCIFYQLWPYLISSVLIDIYDWGLRRHLCPNWPKLHSYFHQFRDYLPIPDLSMEPIGVAIEVVLNLVILDLIQF